MGSMATWNGQQRRNRAGVIAVVFFSVHQSAASALRASNVLAVLRKCQAPQVVTSTCIRLRSTGQIREAREGVRWYLRRNNIQKHLKHLETDKERQSCSER